MRIDFRNEALSFLAENENDMGFLERLREGDFSDLEFHLVKGGIAVMKFPCPNPAKDFSCEAFQKLTTQERRFREFAESLAREAFRLGMLEARKPQIEQSNVCHLDREMLQQNFNHVISNEPVTGYVSNGIGIVSEL